jgi:hypothetical protein
MQVVTFYIFNYRLGRNLGGGGVGKRRAQNSHHLLILGTCCSLKLKHGVWFVVYLEGPCKNRPGISDNLVGLLFSEMSRVISSHHTWQLPTQYSPSIPGEKKFKKKKLLIFMACKHSWP